MSSVCASMSARFAATVAPPPRLEGVPSRGGSTQVMVVDQDSLYDLNFQPDPQGFPQAADDLTRLYNTVVDSFTFTEW